METTTSLTAREPGMLTQGKAGQLGSSPQSPGVELKYTSSRVAKSWKLLPRWEKRGCFQQCKIVLGESYFGNLPHTADTAGSPGQGLDLGHVVSGPEERLRQRILPKVLYARKEAAGMGRRRPRTAMGRIRSPPGSAAGHSCLMFSGGNAQLPKAIKLRDTVEKNDRTKESKVVAFSSSIC